MLTRRGPERISCSGDRCICFSRRRSEKINRKTDVFGGGSQPTPRAPCQQKKTLVGRLVIALDGAFDLLSAKRSFVYVGIPGTIFFGMGMFS